MRILILLVLISSAAATSTGCGPSVGQRCLADAECEPLVCNAPYVLPEQTPVAGTCQHPAPVGGVCHRDKECEQETMCILAPGGTPFWGGTCQRYN